VKELSAFVGEMEEKGVRIIIIDRDLDLSTAQGRAFFNMLATFDQFEREIDGERISAVMQSMKREGTLVTKAPYGFKIEGGKLVENEEEMKMIDLIIMYIHNEPEIRVAEICRRLQWEVDVGNIKLRKTNKIHQKTISEIIKRHNIRTTTVQTATRTTE
jgi:DNA invertase Pin-like site-specific DNA recombinase